jgi:molybdate transport system substrate-binding protein
MLGIDLPAIVRRPIMLAAVGLVAMVAGLPGRAFGEDLVIAAASDLNFAFKELVAGFEKTSGIHVKLTLGSSGNFYSQIQNGAPYDLYFSADVRYPQKLIEAGHAQPDSLYKYAIGRIVLWAPKSSPVPVEQRGMESLLDPSIQKIAVANPKHAPYGRAAVAAMEYFQVHERVKDRLVLGENIAQAAQFVESGAADIGVIALSLALAPSMKAGGKYWEIPASAHPPLEQGAVLLKGSKNVKGARAFLDFIKHEAGQKVMAKYGFIVPDGRQGR